MYESVPDVADSAETAEARESTRQGGNSSGSGGHGQLNAARPATTRPASATAPTVRGRDRTNNKSTTGDNSAWSADGVTLVIDLTNGDDICGCMAKNEPRGAAGNTLLEGLRQQIAGADEA